MKSLKISLSVIATALIFASCENQNTESFGIKNFTYSDCKNSVEESETIHLKTINSEELKIAQRNSVFSCCPDGKLKIEFSLIDDTISLNEFYTDESCNCLCLYDLDYTIGKLEYGECIIQIQHNELQYFRFKINFNSDTDTTIIIKKMKE